MHLRRVLKSYADYYNCVRTHRSLNKDAPVIRNASRLMSPSEPDRTAGTLAICLLFASIGCASFALQPPTTILVSMNWHLGPSCGCPMGGLQDNTVNRLLLMSSKCLVADAVICEPVSTDYFPVLRENNRVLRIFLVLEAVSRSEKPLCSSSFSTNSLRKITGKVYPDNRDRNRINSEIRSG